MSAILVIQPDTAQAKVLHDVARKIHAELIVADSSIQALDAIEQRIPELILVSPLLSPRDEDMLMARLRSLEGAAHVQTVSIPQFSSVKESAPKKKSAFGFGKKKKAAVAVGADPAAFAEEIVTLLNRATEIHNRPASAVPLVPVVGASMPAAAAEPVWEMDSPVHTELPAIAGGAEIADSEAEALSMFTAALAAEESNVWESSVAQRSEEPTIVAMSPVESDFSEVRFEESSAVEPGVTEFTSAPDEADPPLVAFRYPEPTVAEPAPWSSSSLSAPVRSIADEVDELVRQLGLDASFRDLSDDTVPRIETPSDGEAFDFGASLDRARNRSGHAPAVDSVPQVDAEAIRQAAIAEARAAAEREAREASALEIARVLAEAETLRETAIAEARAAAETEAREALAADRLRALAETEQMRESAIAEARAVAEREARDTLAAEVARVRSEAQSTFTDALNKVRVEAEEAERRGVEAERAKAKQLNEEAQEAFARELAKVRAEVEQSLTAQLDAARAEAERVRLAEAEAVRERAAVEQQLKADLERLRFVTAQTRKADESETKRAGQLIKQLEAELATVRAKAEERKGHELEEIRAQMAEMREAAAQHARAAAAEAVAAEVARATVQAAAVVPPSRPTAVITQFPAREIVTFDEPEETVSEGGGGDYLSLWEPRVVVSPPVRQAPEPEQPAESILTVDNLRRHAKWALPAAATLFLAANTGSAISTVARLVKPEERPALTVQAMQEQPPFIEVVEKRVGRLQVDSTPSDAEVILDGKRHGRTPLTIPDLDTGLHTLVLKSSAGTVTRKVTIKANQTTQLAEAIYSGWLAIFSPIPVTVKVDGAPVNLTDDGRVMTTPGRHTVEFINDQFGYSASETLEVRPGATTAHTLVPPMGTLRVTAPDGAIVQVDGQPASGIPSEGLPIAIGAHEISATHPELGVRRAAVDVRHGGITDVTLNFEQ